MTIKDYRPKDYVWFDHIQAIDTRKKRPAVVIRVFPQHDRAILLYGQSRRWPDAILVPAGLESPFPGDTYFAAENVVAVTLRSLQRVSVPPKACKSRLFLALEKLSQRKVQAVTSEENLGGGLSRPELAEEQQ